MVRLALAAVLVLLVIGVLSVFVAGVYRIARADVPDAFDIGHKGSIMQKVAFFLLVALILYVSVSGGA